MLNINQDLNRKNIDFSFWRVYKCYLLHSTWPWAHYIDVGMRKIRKNMQLRSMRKAKVIMFVQIDEDRISKLISFIEIT